MDVVPTLRDIHVSLDAAAAAVSTDHEAALDDILAARLMVSTLLVRLGEDGHR